MGRVFIGICVLTAYFAGSFDLLLEGWSGRLFAALVFFWVLAGLSRLLRGFGWFSLIELRKLIQYFNAEIELKGIRFTFQGMHCRIRMLRTRRWRFRRYLELAVEAESALPAFEIRRGTLEAERRKRIRSSFLKKYPYNAEIVTAGSAFLYGAKDKAQFDVLSEPVFWTSIEALERDRLLDRGSARPIRTRGALLVIGLAGKCRGMPEELARIIVSLGTTFVPAPTSDVRRRSVDVRSGPR